MELLAVPAQRELLFCSSSASMSQALSFARIAHEPNNCCRKSADVASVNEETRLTIDHDLRRSPSVRANNREPVGLCLRANERKRFGRGARRYDQVEQRVNALSVRYKPVKLHPILHTQRYGSISQVLENVFVARERVAKIVKRATGPRTVTGCEGKRFEQLSLPFPRVDAPDTSDLDGAPA